MVVVFLGRTQYSSLISLELPSLCPAWMRFTQLSPQGSDPYSICEGPLPSPSHQGGKFPRPLGTPIFSSFPTAPHLRSLAPIPCPLSTAVAQSSPLSGTSLPLLFPSSED